MQIGSGWRRHHGRLQSGAPLRRGHPRRTLGRMARQQAVSGGTCGRQRSPAARGCWEFLDGTGECLVLS
jgi:hypothetical protein